MASAQFPFCSRVQLKGPNGDFVRGTVNNIFYRQRTGQKLVPVFGGAADNTSSTPRDLLRALIVYEVITDTLEAASVIVDESDLSLA